MNSEPADLKDGGLRSLLTQEIFVAKGMKFPMLNSRRER